MVVLFITQHTDGVLRLDEQRVRNVLTLGVFDKEP